MIKIENVDVYGFEAAIRGCRNSWDSHEKSDSPKNNSQYNTIILGDNDRELLLRLVKAGDSHAKCMRMITVWFDLTAPRYFWTEFDTYHHVVRCSESTMHTITKRELTVDDFSIDSFDNPYNHNSFAYVLDVLNVFIRQFRDTEGTEPAHRLWWRRIIQFLPQSYMQKSTICTNYQQLRNMYHQRKGHRLSEWQEFREWVETLPYSELITE